jgi:hypothetical protein
MIVGVDKRVPMLAPAGRRLWSALPALLPAISACFIVRGVSVEDVSRTSDSVQVRTPVKAHLVDGSTVVYRNGVVVARGKLTGAGTRYGLTLGQPTPITELPLDSIVALESFRTRTNVGATVGISTLATVGVIGASIAVYCAIDPKCFGSCPTFYSDSAGTEVLEAEGFSYSIVPLFESRDVDRLRAQPGPDDTLRLEVRNEAPFETHYINQLELLEARHRPGEFVAPDPQGQPVAVTGQVPPSSARDRTGRDVRDLLADADGRVYATAASVLAHVSATDLGDEIELRFPAPEKGDSLALVLRLRNSLLNTVLLYDVMLGYPGARAIDWQGRDLSRPGSALALDAWYSSRMGLWVDLWRGGIWEPVERVSDTGPVAWKDVVVALPPAAGREVRVRLRFPADDWRIDRIALASSMRRPDVRVLQLARVTDRSGAAEPDAYTSLRAADSRYLETTPGQAFIAAWDVGPSAEGTERTFFLAAQGYYTEWIQRAWITGARDTTVFHPGDRALLRALERWRQVQDTLARRFYATRVPVR